MRLLFFLFPFPSFDYNYADCCIIMFGVTSCVVYDNVSMAQKYPQQWEWTLAPSCLLLLHLTNFNLCLFRSYTEMQRKLCSDGKTWKGDGLVVNRLRRSNSGVEHMFHVFT
ncbi:hypothetical protein MKW92_025830 [Papaver armeniacum]|nr:hypothetical protein MKW92_025830 [Papaver armeniacum]